MKYSKKHVNEILDQVITAANEAIELEDPFKLDKEVELIREEHLLVDQRKSALPEYASEIIFDFIKLQFSYKELMEKYHCSFRNLRSLLFELAEDDERIYDEIELRRK
jgi:hypothetical protein